MQVWKRFSIALALGTTLLATTGCGTISTLGKLEKGAGSEASRMWDRWVEGEGDIAVATTWEAKVKAGVSAKDVEEILKIVAVERNMRDVGVLPLSKELEARSGKKEKLLTVYSYCSPATARKMVDFSPHMSAYLPCRVSVVEHDDGSLWLYTLNMDMMVKMGRKLPSPLKEEAQAVRDTIWEMMQRASKGEF
ncbi:MAG TPA: hypothetical protein DCY64_11415 [Hydrogenophaga sp.]|jgi:uncharacterized protein (DUF302 family)|uniref:DUF302 domain-containing protein n=1 Tax=Hydrogenophaga sp. TaxID=1904254 RepID=UPI0008C3074B|nr:DUF302 domain-containing protein [Hydrogenophaga sp.]MBU4182847.1 DUF302 domain-containing protein [Gammaproteobacteria bacterium]OGA75165.1 MAG: hypothetical protein A2X73_01965 [Burkholderiales bacterium GWE1_65_30]OGA93299.1 MAG: hypothetical protein A2X72_19540 [Burkholderiales bacterium GWF1_66_17]OGB23690.1 MAG: hypothetical protein A3B67_07450 [Burkholderiales bacterium RIFCSPHIGHO2_02_FULL_66_10]OGB27861.1 MAG: hypothetical protein A3I16_06300 [Burkholderiales bacterium RIFCSPLOWO2_